MLLGDWTLKFVPFICFELGTGNYMEDVSMRQGARECGVKRRAVKVDIRHIELKERSEREEEGMGEDWSWECSTSWILYVQTSWVLNVRLCCFWRGWSSGTKRWKYRKWRGKLRRR